MRQFQDNAGRPWTLAINIASLKRVKDTLDVDLIDIDEGRAFTAIGDPYTLGNVLYVLCADQCQAAGVTDEQFGAALAGDAVEAASNALLQEIVDFFPQARRAILREMIARSTAVQRSKLDLLQKRISSGEIEKLLSANTLVESGNLSGKSRAGSRSTRKR